MRKCKNCLLPDSVPGSDIDASGRCRACREQRRDLRERDEAQRQEYEADLSRTLATVRGTGDYDCIVNLSGGKDSCLLLYRIAKEQGLRVLAFTAVVNIPDVAWENIRQTIHRVNVDKVV
jgi:tRNA(Ile)-lysidine synthase TilS/MesJ